MLEDPMKKMMRSLVLFLSLSLLATACGDSTVEEQDDDDGDGSALQCHALGWCTNMSVDDTEVTNAPALSGGSLPEGLYRLEQGFDVEYAEAMLFKGNTVILLEQVWTNYLGTWKVNAGKLEVTRASTCDDFSNRPLREPYTEIYSFAGRGDELFTQREGDDPKVTLRWKRVSDLCEASTSFKCRGGGSCTCVTTKNEPLTDQQNCTL
jgi:hypothetical protein